MTPHRLKDKIFEKKHKNFSQSEKLESMYNFFEMFDTTSEKCKILIPETLLLEPA